MSTNVNTADQIGYRTTGKIMRKLLKRGNYLLCAGKYGQPFTQPKHATLTAKWARYDNFPQATAPLQEGITPPGRKITKTVVTATMEQYGDWSEMSDVVFDTHEDDVPAEAVRDCAEQIGETVEVVTIATLKAGSNVFYANNAGSRSNVDSPPLRGDFRRIERSLATNKASKITSKVAASQKVSTEPIDPAYIVFGHTDLKADLEDMEDFIPVKNYADGGKKIDPAEAGSMGAFRFLLTPLFDSWQAAGALGQTYLSGGDIVSVDTACDVYPMIIVAKNAYGTVRLQGKNAVKPMVHYPKAVPGDELGQRGFVSWKLYYTSVILNSSWVIRYECAATALPN